MSGHLVYRPIAFVGPQLGVDLLLFGKVLKRTVLNAIDNAVQRFTSCIGTLKAKVQPFPCKDADGVDMEHGIRGRATITHGTTFSLVTTETCVCTFILLWR